MTLTSFTLTQCQAGPQSEAERKADSISTTKTKDMEVLEGQATEVATFGNGCFWCTEAVFQSLKGVIKVESGYSGGKISNPPYKEVCSGNTGHAEVIQITYDPTQVTFGKLLEVFFYSHDPTTLNRQGNDVGTQYRSVVFYHSDSQRQQAREVIAKLDKSGSWSDPIVTEVSPFSVFYKAEDYHQDYYNLNGREPYCNYVIKPKVDKFKKAFAQDIK
jgi:peptide-methionine (S)-S-oxide reductase